MTAVRINIWTNRDRIEIVGIVAVPAFAISKKVVSQEPNRLSYGTMAFFFRKPSVTKFLFGQNHGFTLTGLLFRPTR
jgi:hypothetical protein